MTLNFPQTLLAGALQGSRPETGETNVRPGDAEPPDGAMTTRQHPAKDPGQQEEDKKTLGGSLFN